MIELYSANKYTTQHKVFVLPFIKPINIQHAEGSVMRPRSKRYNRKLLGEMEKLYGDKVATAKLTKVASAAKKVNTTPLEEAEQIRFVVWLERKNILFYAVPNEGRRNAHTGARLKRMGMRAGVPDLCLPEPRGQYHGLYIEMKRVVGGVLAPTQRYWLEALRKQGYRAEVCRGADEAIKLTEEYMEVKCLEGKTTR